MSLLPLPTDLHDAGVEQFTFEPLRGRLTISLLLAVPNGISLVRKQLLLSGISNGKEVLHLQHQIDLAKSRSNSSALGYRLEDFSYHNPLASNKAELAIRLAIDHLPVLIIQCKKLTVQTLI
jgi:hypothetical protein